MKRNREDVIDDGDKCRILAEDEQRVYHERRLSLSLGKGSSMMITYDKVVKDKGLGYYRLYYDNVRVLDYWYQYRNALTEVVFHGLSPESEDASTIQLPEKAKDKLEKTLEDETDYTFEE